MVQLLHIFAYTTLGAVQYAAWLYNDRRTDDGFSETDTRGILAVLAGNAVFIFGGMFLLRRWDSPTEFGIAAVVVLAAVGWHYYTRRERPASGA